MLDGDTIRERLAAMLDQKGLKVTGKKLQQAGVGQTTIRNYLDGTTRSLTVETLSKLEGVGIDVIALLYGEQERSAISDEDLARIADEAADEIEPGMPIGLIRRSVSSRLRELLEQLQSQAASAGTEGAATERDTASLSPAPTKPT